MKIKLYNPETDGVVYRYCDVAVLDSEYTEIVSKELDLKEVYSKDWMVFIHKYGRWCHHNVQCGRNTIVDKGGKIED